MRVLPWSVLALITEREPECSEKRLRLVVRLRGRRDTDVHVLAFHSKSFLMAVDCLGYFFMSLSTFFTAFAFSNVKWLFRGLLYNGLLLPVLVLAFFYPVFYYVGALWMITFPVAMMNWPRSTIGTAALPCA